MKNFLLYTILFLSLLGAIDAGYLLFETISGQAVVCPNVPVGRFNLDQCNIVLSTPYAKTFGLPNAFYGLAAYLTFAILVLYELNRPNFANQNLGGQAGKRKKNSIKLLSYLSGFGILTFIYFIYLQIFVIKALCFYCLLSAFTITLIFALSVAYNLKYSASEGVYPIS